MDRRLMLASLAFAAGLSSCQDSQDGLDSENRREEKRREERKRCEERKEMETAYF